MTNGVSWFSGAERRLLPILLGALCFLLLGSSAQAATNHTAAATFDRPDEGAAPTSIAIDEQSGSVYLLSGSTLEKFDADGNPSNFTFSGTNTIQGCGDGSWGCYQVAVDNSGGTNQGVIYVSDLTPYPFGSQGVRAFLPSGEKLVKNIVTMSEVGTAGSPCGVAVDEAGNLVISYAEWFGNVTVAFVDKLSVPDWATEGEVKPTPIGEYGVDFPYSCRTQFDSTGAAYQLSAFGLDVTGAVSKVAADPFGTPNESGGGVPASLVREGTPIDEGPNLDIAVDAEDNLYVTRSGSALVRKYDPAGSVVEAFGSASLGGPSAVAVNRSTGVVYVSDRGGAPGSVDVHLFTPVTVPDSLTGEYEAETQTSGELTGEVDPLGKGAISSCEFEYVAASKYSATEFEEATTLPCEQATPLGAATDVTAPVTGLTLEQPYVFRLQSAGPTGTSNGTARRFTPHGVIGLATKAATEVAPRSAKLNATFLGNGDGTEYFFEYGLSRVYGSQTATEALAGPTGATAVSAPLGALELETTYHYRVVAVNGTGTSIAEDRTFTTPPAVAGVVTKAATEINQETITLNGEFLGAGLPTHYYFEYGPTKTYGLLSEAPPGSDAGSPTGPTPVSSEIADYKGYTTYHYRVVTVNDLGTTYGKDQIFETPDAAAPTIRGGSATDVAPTTATLSAEVNPGRWATSYAFEWGPDSDYGSQTSLESVLGGLKNEFQPITAAINRLAPGTIYHYRVVAINLTGTTNGPDLTFATPAAPGIESVAVTGVTETSAHLSALVSAKASPTSVRFEFGTTPAYGSSTSTLAIGGDLVARPVDTDLAGLTPGTTYHFRVVAENGIGTSTGSNVTFKTRTSPTAPAPEPKVAPKKCPKGKVKRRGKCMKKPAKKKRGGKRGKNNG